jgi:sec-independent protein translocase protein TatB
VFRPHAHPVVACYLRLVFGMGFGEMMIVAIVGMVVFGPKELPKMLRKAGVWAGKIRRFALDMRVQSGIDEALRSEGLDRDLAEIRKLTRGELDGVVSAARSVTRFDAPAVRPTAAAPAVTYPAASPDDVPIDRDREYPKEGADSYDAIPDSATVYAEGLPLSPLADDPLYARGDATRVPAVAVEEERASTG